MPETQAAREQLVAERRGIIGGSDAPAIVKYYSGADFRIPGKKTAFQVWARLTGRVEESATEDNDILRRGRLLEAATRTETEIQCRKAGHDVTIRPVGELRVHPTLSWMGVHLDGDVLSVQHTKPGVYEGKAPLAFTRDEWEGETPEHAQIQAHHGLIIMHELTGADWGIVSGWMSMYEGVAYQEIEWSPKLVDGILEAESEFMKLVETDTAPEPEAADLKLIGKVFEAIEGAVVDLPDDADAWAIDEQKAAVEIKRWTEIRKEAQAKLAHAIASGGGEYGRLPCGGGYSYKEIHRKGYTVEPTSYRQLRFKKGA